MRRRIQPFADTRREDAVKSLLLQVLFSFREAFLEFLGDWRAVGRYLIEPEVHVYSFSIAANVLLAFWPFQLVMLSIAKHVLHSTSAINALFLAIQDCFAGETGAFLVRNLNVRLLDVYKLEWVSILLLLFTANGVFLPLEVALNRAWDVPKGRNLLMNQVVSTALIFSCGILVLVSAAVTGSADALWGVILRDGSHVPLLISKGLFKLASIPFTILILFLIYWRLPNTRVPWREVLPRAAVIGLFLEALKWINFAIWPWLFAKFDREYSVFKNSITVLMWSFLAGLVVLAGADWSARHARRAEELAKDAAAAAKE
jgi:membrane protein